MLVAKARAEVDRLRASALTRVGAANLLAAREMIPLIDSLRGGIVVGLDPFDPQQWMTRFCGEATMKQATVNQGKGIRCCVRCF